MLHRGQVAHLEKTEDVLENNGFLSIRLKLWLGIASRLINFKVYLAAISGILAFIVFLKSVCLCFDKKLFL